MSDVTAPSMGKMFNESQPSNKDNSEDELLTMSTLRKILNHEIRVVMKKELEVMVLPIIHRVLLPIAEDLIRRVVKEQLELATTKFFAGAQSNPEDERRTSQPRRLTLQFRNGLSLPILTGHDIRAEENEFLEVVLVDDLSGEVVESGPEACAKVEIVAVEVNKSEEESSGTSGKKDKKKPLLSGEVVLTLSRGVGVLKNVKFRHTERWMKKNECKLSACAVGTFDGVHIREAQTESFHVKDRRNENYKNKDVPELSDEVWRLKNIPRTKKIYECLNNVEDFLRELFKDPLRLKDLFGMKPRNWEMTVEHARKCKLDKRMSCYSDSQKKTVVVFNLVEQVLGVISEGQYIPVEKLDDDAKAAAHKLAMDALDNSKDVKCFDDEASALRHFCSQELELPRGEDTETSQMMGECSCHPGDPSPNHGTFSSMNSCGDTPGLIHSLPKSIDADFHLAPENVPRMALSDKEKEGVLEMPVHIPDKGPVFYNDEASLEENFSRHPPTAPMSSSEMVQSVEAFEMTDEYYRDPEYGISSLPLIYPDGDTSCSTQSTTAHNVIDEPFQRDLSRESPEVGFLYDDNTFCLGSSPAALYFPRSQSLERPPGGHDLEVSGMVDEVGFSNSYTEFQPQPSSSHACVNDLNLTKNAAISASIPDNDRLILGDRPSKARIMLINVLSLRRVALRTVNYERLLQYLLLQCAFVTAWKKRRLE